MQATMTAKNSPSMTLPTPRFPSKETYREYCHGVIAAYRSTSTEEPPTPTFHSHMKKIEQGGEMVIPTSWGGVDIIHRDDPTVEKFLVVKGGSFLAFEKHDEKVETLIGEEGFGVLVYRPEGETELKAEVIRPGWTRTLQPGQEHTIVALSDLLVREKSLDYKGMDKDLIFLFMPTDS